MGFRLWRLKRKADQFYPSYVEYVEVEARGWNINSLKPFPFLLRLSYYASKTLQLAAVFCLGFYVAFSLLEFE